MATKYEPDRFDLLAGVVCGFIGLGIGGYAAVMGWRWFVVPFGAPEIAFWHAVGLVILTRGSRYYPDPTSESEWLTECGKSITRPLILWGFMWIASRFM